jgi:murein DD-endopeptidase MepM/ murein hydrolase activator NlpD
MRRASENANAPRRGSASFADRGSSPSDVGNEPPLHASGGAGEVDRRAVNLRWLGASVLTGVTGAALIGGAIYVALQGETTSAAFPDTVAVAPRAPAGEGRAQSVARKGDKLVRSEVVAVAKQSFRAPVTERAGDREVIRVRPFVRIATNLSLTSGVYATDIPRFNPLRVFADGTGERFAEPAPEAVDADVSVMKHDLTGLAAEPALPSLSDDDVAAQIHEEYRAALDAGRRPSVPIAPQLLLSRTRQAGGLHDALGYTSVIDAPFSSIEVRVVPENVKDVVKTELRPGASLIEERDVTLKRGEVFEGLLKSHGATNDQIRSIVTALGGRSRTGALTEGQRVRILLAPVPDRLTEGRQVSRVVLFGERGIEGIAAANDRGVFVSVTPPVEEGPRAVAQNGSEEEEENEEGGVRLYESLYETAMKHDLPRQTVEDLVRIFVYDVDFQRRTTPGDTFELFYTTDEEGGERPEILSAALTIGGEPRRVYRFQSPDDGAIEYFDESGRSLKKFLIRKPLAEGRFTSGFGYRRHPVLGYTKMHTGTDWAERIGAPIVASGNGTVTKAEWDSGYGRRVEIQHANGYVTAYSHQSRFAAGIRAGAQVRQGQVIGFVGSTGLSTGPHLHYEVIVNGRFVDPMKIRVPRGRELDGRQLAEFKRQKDQTDALIQRATNTRLAQTDSR